MISNDSITTNSSKNYTVNASSIVQNARYYDTLSGALGYVKKYLEEHLGQKTEVCVELVTIVFNGNDREMYKVSCAASYNTVTVPYTPQIPSNPNPWITPVPQEEWWKTPYVWCGETPKVEYGTTYAGNSVACPAGQDTKVGCIMQSYSDAQQLKASQAGE